MSRPALSEAGFYGKMPSRGDFVTRALPSAFVRAWDGWLAASIDASRRALGAAWLERFLLAPPWRFALAPGIAGPTGWIGVMATSIDAVGRAFPLTLAGALPAGVGLGRLAGDPTAALGRLERLALALIDGSLDPEAASGEVGAVAAAAVTAATAPVERHALGGPDAGGWATDGRPQASIAVRLTMTARAAGFDDRSLWWHEGGAGTDPRTIVCVGLPDPALFEVFLARDAAAPATAGSRR